MVRASWGPRFESYEACVNKLERILPAIDCAIGDHPPWLVSGGRSAEIAGNVGQHMYQNLSDVDKSPLEYMGWSVSLHRGSPRSLSVFRVQSGAEAWTGNSVFLEFPDQLDADWRPIRSLILEIQTIYEPDAIIVSSTEGLGRRVKTGQPSPVVDWMVYLANTIIPAEELPMVHSVERVGSGTLVILKKEPINLEKPEDLALVEAVEPVIRSHQPDLSLKPPPRRPRTT